MGFPNDPAARAAHEIYLRCDDAAARDTAITLSADEYLTITSPNLSRTDIITRAVHARRAGVAAAFPFVHMYQASPHSKPSLAKAYRAAAEIKADVYAKTKKTLTEVYPDVHSDRVDRKYFEELRREFEPVLHFWMALSLLVGDLGASPNMRNTETFSRLLADAEKCAEYLASIKFGNRSAPPIDVSKLIRFSATRR
ncbi:hypothetical protein WJ542_03505 [Paraburkholderia sp. B3]|uniref:hypothetical protein n=1 Tax=Paraburkholderia sp. B3 TaxID=3134791 RepID=UPI0039826511